jgi:sortase A
MSLAPPAFRAGSHSHNAGRSAFRESKRQDTRLLLRVKQLLFAIGLICIGYYLYALGNRYVYERYENWAFDQEIAGRTGVSFTEYIREVIPAQLLGSAKPQSIIAPSSNQPATMGAPVHLAEGDLVGRVSIQRLGLSAVVREGVDAKTLSTSVGHIPSTALPGADGNFAIAAHRDTLFRALKNIRLGDEVTIESPNHRYVYEVVATKIVKPSDVSVLRSDGGGLYTPAGRSAEPERLLTMITCYPFYYVGSAPKRFIVESKLVSSSPLS